MIPDPERLVHMTIASDLPPLDQLRSRISASLPGVHDQTVSDVELIATELVTNAYLHGSPPTQFHLYYLPDATRLRMEVSDAGTALPQLNRPTVQDVHGRGLLLVEAMCVAWGVAKTESGKTVWAEFAVLPATTSELESAD